MQKLTALKEDALTHSDPGREAKVLQSMIEGLSPLDDETRVRLLDTVARFFDLGLSGLRPGVRQAADTTVTRESPRTEVPLVGSPAQSDQTPKQFLIDKSPRTLVDRVACLAYYLTLYRGTPHFKTFDISQLNTEAAQTKFSNTAQSVADATRAGLLAAAGKGNKQLSALGEQYVQALPDIDAARAVAKQLKPKTRSARKKKASNTKKSK